MSSVVPFPGPSGPDARLRPEHLDHLRSSGLSDQTIAAARICSLSESQTRRLGYAKGLSGIGFPYPGTRITVAGELHAYTRLRVDPERRREPGRKYENPLKASIDEGLTFYPYVPLDVDALRKDATRPVVVTEGEKKALKLTQEGWPAIGLPGVFLFTDPRSSRPPGKRPLHPDLERWRWRGRTVFVCFDSDRTDKEGVALAHERLCAALTRKGARVRDLGLPALGGLDKTGADDFLVRRGPAAFGDLVDRARPWEPFAWLVELVPAGLPPAALEEALVPARGRLLHVTPDELRVVAARLCERYPALSEGDAIAMLAAGRSAEAPLPEIITNNRQVRDLADDAWKALQRSPMGARVYRYGDALVYVPDGPDPCQEPLDAAKLTALLNRAATWLAECEDGVRNSRVPQDVVRDMIALPSGSVRHLEGLARLPVLRPDGTVHQHSGYDARTRLLSFVPAELSAAVTDLGVEPDPDKALRFLGGELLGDFPFARDSDRAHALAALLLPVVRHLVEGPTPLHLVEAPTPGTGKTLLADVVHLVATGCPADPTPLPRREEEVRKKITSTLLGNPALVLLDNINHGIDSSSLAAALTKDRWSDRLLGQSRMVPMPNRAVWLATANNPVLSREMSRRAVRIRLDADSERPWLRDGFRHADLPSWVRAHRGAIVAALIDLARAWLLAGRPPSGPRLGSYASWSANIGGILGHAGVPGFLADREHDHDAEDPVEADWRALVACWSERFGRESVDGKDLLGLAAEHGLFDLAPGDLDRRAKASFSRGLSRRRDRIYDGQRIVVVRDRHRKVSRYALQSGRRP